MKRFVTATALTALFASSAMALTEREEVSIKRFAPDAQLWMYDDTTIASAMNIIDGGDSFSERQAKVRALLRMDDASTQAKFNQAQLAAMSSYVTPDQLADMTRAEKRAVLNYISAGGSESELRSKIDGLLIDDKMESAGNDATIGEANLIAFYAPELDVSELSQDELVAVLNIINSTDSRASIDRKIDGLVGS